LRSEQSLTFSVGIQSIYSFSLIGHDLIHKNLSNPNFGLLKKIYSYPDAAPEPHC